MWSRGAGTMVLSDGRIISEDLYYVKCNGFLFDWRGIMSIHSIADAWKTCDDRIRTYLYGPEHGADGRSSMATNHDDRPHPVIGHRNADGEWRICKAKEGHCVFEHRRFSSIEELNEANRNSGPVIGHRRTSDDTWSVCKSNMSDCPYGEHMRFSNIEEISEANIGR